MAANNYFGFSAGGTQYSTTPAVGYQTGTTGYAAVPAAAAPVAAAQAYAAPRVSQATYDPGYQTTAATYAYTSRPQETAHTHPAGSTATYTDSSYYNRSTQAVYEKSQPYYQHAQVATYTATETPAAAAAYQNVAKPTYSNNNFTARQTPASAKTQNTAQNSTGTSGYMYSGNVSNNNYSAPSSFGSTPVTTSATFSGYDAALYSAATVYLQQQQQHTTSSVSTTGKGHTGTWMGYKKGNQRINRLKQPPKPEQIHYCDVCKISCAGPQTYKEHLEGQKHKKKEAASKTGNLVQVARGMNSLRCELCDVTCTGFDAYAAHIRGAKHQKVVKLHTKLGKPIPSTEPVVVTNSSSSTTTTTSKAGTSKTVVTTTTKAVASASSPGVTKRVLATPKITFVGGTKLNTTVKNEDVKMEDVTATTESAKEEVKADVLKLDDKADIQPVGLDYIEEIKNDEGKVISFQCKLCECRFNDPNAKEMHMKGRRHRLQYKKKVNPDLVVDIKPSMRQKKIQEERMRRQQMKEDMWRRRDEDRWREEMRMMEEEERFYWEERRRYEEEMEYYEWYRRYGPDRPHPMGPPGPRMMFNGPHGPNGPPPPPMPMAPPIPPMMQPMRRPDTADNRYVMAKHSEIYPKENELAAVQRIVSNTEKALKMVSDYLAETDNSSKDDTPAEAPKTPAKEEPAASSDSNKNGEDKDGAAQRVLKGVMRVGALAKGLLLHSDLNVQLIVLCSEKPTRTLLERVADNLPKQLVEVAPDEKYELKRCVEEAAIILSSLDDLKPTVTITLTSPVMRESPSNSSASGETVKTDPPDVLDRQKCLAALAALRHAKWFQARANGLQSCVITIRIMRDLCQRVPTWAPLSGWAMELLVEKVISSAGQPIGPGDALRRIFEAIASGIFLPGGLGLMDPCEKEEADAATSMTNQQREDITSSAQHALRLLAFRQIHKVLGMDPLPAPKFSGKGRFTRKRRRDSSNNETGDDAGDGKKDKKEGDGASEASK